MAVKRTAVIQQICQLSLHERQLKLNWLSARTIAILVQFGNAEQAMKIKEALTKQFWQKVEAEMKINVLGRAAKSLIEDVFKRAAAALERDTYRSQLKDKGYYIPRRYRK
ncbi:MAG TPA: hypothetical protein VKS21_08445 [Spirochaetota bacterium]|nr:hypothetical protein [Spirochaetota bacterium]